MFKVTIFINFSNFVRVVELNGELQNSGNSLTSVMRKQIESQTTIENIDEAIDTLKASFCEYVRSNSWAEMFTSIGSRKPDP